MILFENELICKYCLYVCMYYIKKVKRNSTLKSVSMNILIESPRGSSISCEPRLMKQRLQVRIPPPPTLAWTCQKKKKKKNILIEHQLCFIVIRILIVLLIYFCNMTVV
jgi:hypothetical protein